MILKNCYHNCRQDRFSAAGMRYRPKAVQKSIIVFFSFFFLDKQKHVYFNGVYAQ